MITITTSAHGWAMLRWQREDDAVLAADLAALAVMPGVQFPPEGRFVEVPATVWGTSTWQHVRQHVASWSPPFTRQRSGWEPRRPLFAHQRTGVEFLVEAGGGLCADQMGLGKTTTAIVSAERLARQTNPDGARLIVGPSYTRDVWRRELLALGAIDDAREFCAVRTRNSSDPSFRPREARWWFCHYDVAHAWASRLATNGRGRPTVAIVDEAHWVKNGRAQRSRGTFAAAGVASSRILLSGTPLANRPSELWHLLTLLDGSGAWGSPTDFRRRYCGAQHDGYGWQDAGPTNTSELRERMGRRYLRRTIDDAGVELPSLTRQVIEAEMSDADRLEHFAVVEGLGGIDVLLEDLDRGAFGAEVLRAMARLRKLTSEAKLRTTADHVASLLDQDEPVVVFCHERRTASRLASMIDPDDCFVATGEHSQDERDEVVRRFQAGERNVVLTTFGAMREGVTLHRARCVVLHDLSWVPSDVLQAEARVHRLGQGRPCVATWVMVEDSFDTLLARSIATKGAAIEATIGDGAVARAVRETGLEKFRGPSVEDEARRLLDLWQH